MSVDNDAEFLYMKLAKGRYRIRKRSDIAAKVWSQVVVEFRNGELRGSEIHIVGSHSGFEKMDRPLFGGKIPEMNAFPPISDSDLKECRRSRVSAKSLTPDDELILRLIARIDAEVSRRLTAQNLLKKKSEI
jgi:hypothetical protein